MAVLAAGFLLTAVEVRFLHRNVAPSHAVAWTPTASCVIGALAALLAMSSRSALRWGAAAMFAGVLLAGVVGLYVHTEFEPSAFAALAGASTHATPDVDEDEETSSRRETPADSHASGDHAPALAPLSLTGMAALGLIAFAGRSGQRQ